MATWQAVRSRRNALFNVVSIEGAKANQNDASISPLVCRCCVGGPWFLLLMLLIKRDSPGPAIFAQPRVGRNNHRYQCYKLRTMHDDLADPNGNRSTARDDDRVTRIGKFLRRTSLDELPQLWNVIRGDMSLAGPRPHALAHDEYYTRLISRYPLRHRMKPGITGLAQVGGLRGETATLESMAARVEADIRYID